MQHQTCLNYLYTDATEDDIYGLVEYTFEKGFKGSFDEPGYPAEVFITSITTIDGKLIPLKEVSDAERERIESECHEYHYARLSRAL